MLLFESLQFKQEKRGKWKRFWRFDKLVNWSHLISSFLAACLFIWPRYRVFSPSIRIIKKHSRNYNTTGTLLHEYISYIEYDRRTCTSLSFPSRGEKKHGSTPDRFSHTRPGPGRNVVSPDWTVTSQISNKSNRTRPAPRPGPVQAPVWCRPLTNQCRNTVANQELRTAVLLIVRTST